VFFIFIFLLGYVCIAEYRTVYLSGTFLRDSNRGFCTCVNSFFFVSSTEQFF